MMRARLGHGILIGAFGVSVAFFLLKLAYTPWLPGTLLTLALLAAGWVYARKGWGTRVPWWVLGSLFLAVQVDLLGNDLELLGLDLESGLI